MWKLFSSKKKKKKVDTEHSEEAPKEPTPARVVSPEVKKPDSDDEEVLSEAETRAIFSEPGPKIKKRNPEFIITLGPKKLVDSDPQHGKKTTGRHSPGPPPPHKSPPAAAEKAAPSPGSSKKGSPDQVGPVSPEAHGPPSPHASVKKKPGAGPKKSRSLQKQHVHRRTVRKPVFPVEQIHDLLEGRGKAKSQVDASVPVFIAAVEEYLATELLECSSNLAKHRGSRFITEHDIIAIIYSDESMVDTLKGCIQY